MLKINYNQNIENIVKGEVMKQSGILQNNLVVLRAEKRWSQTDLANKAGVSRQTIASIEANRYNPSLILAFEIAHILGKEFHEVFQYKIEGNGMSIVIGIIISVAGLIGVLYSTRFQKNEGKMKEASILQEMPLKFHYLYFYFYI